MVDLEKAKELVQQMLDRHNPDDDLIIYQHREITGKGWIIFYNSQEYLETGNESAMLLGNGPIIVDYSGRLFSATAGETEDRVIEEFNNGELPEIKD